MVHKGLGNLPLIGIEKRIKNMLLMTDENKNSKPRYWIVHNPCCLQPWMQLSMLALNRPFSLSGQMPREVKQEQELGMVVKAKEVQCWHSGIITNYVKPEHR
jgi:hypothetical protein